MSYTGDSGQFSSDDPIFSKFLAYNRKYGDSIIPHLPDTPDLTVDQRVEYYGSLLDIVRNIMPDPDAVRSARVSMRHERDKGYVCLLYTSPSPRDQRGSRMPSSA